MKKLVASMPMTLTFGGKMSTKTELLASVASNHFDRIDKLEATVAELAKRIEALEAWHDKHVLMEYPINPLDTPPDPFGKYVGQKPSLAADLMAGVRATQRLANNLYDATVNNHTMPAPQPELVKGFWYKDAGDRLVQWNGIGHTPCIMPPVRLATLDDLSHEAGVGGIKIWMVGYDDGWTTLYRISDDGNSFLKHCNMYTSIAQFFAAPCHISIITEAQWRELTK